MHPVEDRELLRELGLTDMEAAFDDGVIAEVSLTPLRALQLGETLPVRPWAVRLVQLDEEPLGQPEWDAVFRSPLLSEARSLEVVNTAFAPAPSSAPPHLERLRIGHMAVVGEDAFAAWSALPRLTHFSGHSFRVEKLLASGALDGLHSLSMPRTALDDVTPLLRPLPRLRHLQVLGSVVPALARARPRWLEQLRTLSIASPAEPIDVVDLVERLPHLEHLHVAGALGALGMLPRLRLTTLRLDPQIRLRADDLRALVDKPAFAAVDDVDVAVAEDVDQAPSLELLRRLLPRLRRLHLFRARLTNGALRRLLEGQRAPATLHLDHSRLDDRAVHALGTLDGLDALLDLAVGGGRSVTTLTPIAKSRALPSLTRLNLNDVVGVDAIAAAPFAPQLRWLFATRQEKQTIAALRQAMPACVVIDEALDDEAIRARERRLSWHRSDAGF